MSNWYTSETWFSANDVQAWNPQGASVVTGGSGGGGVGPAGGVKTVKAGKAEKVSKKPPSGTSTAAPPTTTPTTTTPIAVSVTTSSSKLKTTKSTSVVPPPTPGSAKFHELPSNAATNKSDWDAYISKEAIPPSSPRSSLPSTPSRPTPPAIPSDEFDTLWEPLGSPSSSISTSSTPTDTDTTSSGTAVTPSAGVTTSTKETPVATSALNKSKRNSDIEAELNRQNLYKTELCQSWCETGSCRYGPKCQFAHGEHELRPVLRHPKYKTEICKTFSTTGQCPYGKRCRFVHQLSELRTPLDASNPILLEGDENQEEDTVEIQRQLNELNLGLLPPPVSTVFPTTQPEDTTTPESTGNTKKGSRLPFFQKLRKQK